MHQKIHQWVFAECDISSLCPDTPLTFIATVSKYAYRIVLGFEKIQAKDENAILSITAAEEKVQGTWRRCMKIERVNRITL